MLVLLAASPFLAAFSPSTVNVVLFDPSHGADQCRCYACKYCGKPEPWYYLQTRTPGGEANPVKRFLQARNVGLCMACSRLLGYRLVRSTRPTQFLFPQFTVARENRIQRTDEHRRTQPRYADPGYYLNDVQKFFYRHQSLRHLCLGQFFRYFSHPEGDAAVTPVSIATHEDTLREDTERAKWVRNAERAKLK